MIMKNFSGLYGSVKGQLMMRSSASVFGFSQSFYASRDAFWNPRLY